MKKLLVSCLAFILVLTHTSPAQAVDVSGPVPGPLGISPSVVDVTSSDATITLNLSVADATGVRYASIMCSDPTGYRPLFFEIQPRNINGNPQVMDAWNGGYLAIDSFIGDQTNFSIQFRAIIKQQDFPGTFDCHFELMDTLWNETLSDSGKRFSIIKRELGLPTPSLAPTPSPPVRNLPSQDVGPVMESIKRVENLASDIGIFWIGGTATLRISRNKHVRQIDLKMGRNLSTLFLSGSRPVEVTLPKTPPRFPVVISVWNRNGTITTRTQRTFRYSSCEELNRVFLGGIQKARKTPNRGSVSSVRPTTSRLLYTQNSNLDIDRDGIVCER